MQTNNYPDIDVDRLSLVYYPDPKLTMPTYNKWAATSEYKTKFINKMHDLMMIHNGIGLAAPQVGSEAPCFVMEYAGKRRNVFYPIIVSTSEHKVVMPEGCLSDPGLYLSIRRPSSIVVQYKDEVGNEVNEELHAMTARCFLHEFDHINRILFTDRASKLKLSMARKKRNKHNKLLKSKQK